MRFWCANLRRESDVFPSVQGDGHVTSTGVGHNVSARAVLADVLLQLLVGVSVSDHRAFVESRELCAVGAGGCLLADFAAFDVDCSASNNLLFVPGISAGIFSFFLWREEKGFALSVGDHPAVGQ